MAASTNCEFDHKIMNISISKFTFPSFYTIMYNFSYKIGKEIHMNFELYCTATSGYYENGFFNLCDIESLDIDVKPDLDYYTTNVIYPIVAVDIEFRYAVPGVLVMCCDPSYDQKMFKYCLNGPIQRYIAFDFSYITK